MTATALLPDALSAKPLVSAPARDEKRAGSSRLPMLDALRGIASLAVCWFHMTNGAQPGFLRSSGSKGWMGVEMFFVISGFIIPYSMFRAGYRLSDFGRFVLKRLIRLDPPYIASLALVLLLDWLSTLSPLYRGAPFHVSMPQLLLHFGYLNVFFGYPWLNLVYWTLAIELQFYLLAALVFPLVASDKLRVWVPAFAILAASAWLTPETQYIFVYVHLFLLGMAAFKFRVGQLGVVAYVDISLAITVALSLVLGRVVAGLGLATALTIAFINVRVPILSGIGVISYSLYLVHVPIGGRVVNLGARFVHSSVAHLALSLVATAVSLAAAWLLYALIERPAQRWSSRLRFRSNRGSLSPITTS